MPRPWTINEIVERRQKVLQTLKNLREEHLKKAQGSLSDQGNQTVSVNIPAPPENLCIVSWNIQTFEAGKSLSNPFVNVVINGVLEALSADICILLETRADSYINMNAIETGDRGSGKWKLSGTEDDQDPSDEMKDEDDEDDGGDDQDDQKVGDEDEDLGAEDDDDPESEPDGVTDSPGLDGGEPLRYLQLVSEMTGKRWVPPARVYVYHPATVETTKLIKEFKRLKSLLAKLAAQTGQPENQVDVFLVKVAAITPRKKAVDKFKAEVEKLAPKPVKGQKKGQKKPKKLTIKETRALIGMYAKLLKDPKRYDAVKSAPSAAVTFADSYQWQPKWLKSHCVADKNPSDGWKLVLLSDQLAPVRDYYELFALDDNYAEALLPQWTDTAKVAVDQNWRFFLRLKKCPACNKSLGTGECAKCEAFGPLTAPLSNLRQALGEITFYRGSAQESYSVLVRPSSTVSGPSEGGIWLNGKRVQVITVAAKLLMREPHVKEIVKGTKQVKVKAGKMLGYQDGSVKFYGRCPYCIPLHAWYPYFEAEERIPVIGFHGPYGASTNDGVQVRAASMTELLKAGVGAEDVPLKDSPNAIVMGDFNLDWAPGEVAPETKQQIANELYEGFKKLDFQPMVEGGVATSLITIYDKAAKWRGVGGTQPSTSQFTSSAYDNLFIKGDGLRSRNMHSAVVDVISWIEDHLANFQINPADEPPAGFDQLPAKTQAFYIYHRYVSDHLPILCDIVVQGMPDTSPAAQSALALRQQINKQMETDKATESYGVVMQYETLLDLELAGDEADYYSKWDEGDAHYAQVIGVVFAHQDGYLLIRSSPLPKHVLWLTYRPERNGKPIGGLFLQKFFEIYKPGTRVMVDVLNPRFLP